MIEYDKFRINCRARDVEHYERTMDDLSDVDITDDEAKKAHDFVIKQMEDFVMKEEDLYDYLIESWFGTYFDFEPYEG